MPYSVEPATPRLTLGGIVFSMIFHSVSDHAKRILYLSSLNEEFNRYDLRCGVTVGKLNETMKLARREETMHIPEVLRTQVWRGTGLAKLLRDRWDHRLTSYSEQADLARLIVSMSKRWHYGDESQMESDVRGVLEAQFKAGAFTTPPEMAHA